MAARVLLTAVSLAAGVALAWAALQGLGLLLWPVALLCFVAAWKIATDVRAPHGRPARVVFDDDRVTSILPDGRTESIAWKDLAEVNILTTDAGPFAEDVFFMLTNADRSRGCVVAQEAEGQKQLLERLQQLPGFRNEEVIRAMGSTENAMFLCWRRDAAPAAGERAPQ